MVKSLLYLMQRKKTRIVSFLGVIIVCIAGFFFYYYSEELVLKDAEREIQNLLLQHKALHLYIQRNTHPALYRLKEEGEVKQDFYSPELLSSSYMTRVIHEYLNEVRQEAHLSNIYYKMAALNPRNPVNIADDFEAEIIKQFNANRQLKHDHRIVEREGVKYLYYAVPFLETTEACLKCHGDRNQAPRQLQDRYQGMGGFGDQVGNIRAIESIRIPLARIIQSAHIFFFVLLGAVAIIIIILFLSQRLRAMVRQRTRDLRESEDRFRRLAENAKDMIYRMTLPEGKYEYVSPASTRIFGYTPSEFYQTPFLIHRIIHPDWVDAFMQQWNQILEGNPSPIDEYQIYSKSCESRWLNQRTVVIKNDQGTPIAVEGIITDVTERKHLEEQLLQSQKMEAIGHLAGGVAHDFNNMLMPILGYSEYALTVIPPENELHADLLEIKKAGERAASLTRQLLAFSRKQILQPKILHFNELIATMVKMLRRLIGEDIDLSIELAPDLGWVKADPGQIEQIIMNLALNARDAMPRGGKLTIETRNVNFDHSYIRSHRETEEGDYAMIAISDNGCGMDKETLKQIFDPFFTTKEVGKGTGLGLSTVYGIVSQSGGHIYTYSEPGQGTTFKIYFPRLGDHDAVKKPIQNHPNSFAGTNTILLVEDEEIVRNLVLRILQQNGYQVLVAITGESAIEMGDRFEKNIDVLVTDVVLPTISGRQVAEYFCTRRPEMKVLYMSGYTDNAIVHHGILDDGIAFLHKPFSSETLLQKIYELCQNQ